MAMNAPLNSALTSPVSPPALETRCLANSMMDASAPLPMNAAQVCALTTSV
jgi:hypothetical protein